MAKLSGETAKEWNKAQADLLRAIADRIEAGEYRSLELDNVAYYALGVTKPFAPAVRHLGLKVEYIEQESANG